MAEKNEFQSLKKLYGAEKDDYLAHLSDAVMKTCHTPDIALPITAVNQLTKILGQADCVEIDVYTGLPTTMRILQIDMMAKDVKKELQDLKSRLSSGSKADEEKTLEQLIVDKVKSKIYSFDTLASEEIASENVPFCDILSSEFTLRDKLYLLRAIESNPFMLSPQISMNYDMSAAGYYTGKFSVAGFDSKANKFAGYKFYVDFTRKGRKRLIDEENSKLKQVYEEILKRQFATGNIDSLYKEFSDIKQVWLRKVTRSSLASYHDKNNVEFSGLPKSMFKDNPNTYVMDVSFESIETMNGHGEDFKWTDKSKTQKLNLSLKVPHADITKLVKKFYENDKSVALLGEDLTKYGTGGGPGGING
ncbi:hypothetical protein FJZ53_02580 [Candidatus Woesearchaeota archaeon]|nr:hypothetical protein [Candidatus Woesearchaeota archaeon]